MRETTPSISWLVSTLSSPRAASSTEAMDFWGEAEAAPLVTPPDEDAPLRETDPQMTVAGQVPASTSGEASSSGGGAPAGPPEEVGVAR